MYLKVLSKIFVFKFGDVIIPFLDGNGNAFEDQNNYSNYLGGKGGGDFQNREDQRKDSSYAILKNSQ